MGALPLGQIRKTSKVLDVADTRYGDSIGRLKLPKGTSIRLIRGIGSALVRGKVTSGKYKGIPVTVHADDLQRKRTVVGHTGVTTKAIRAKIVGMNWVLYDDVQPVMVPVSELWRHREYTWTRDDSRMTPEEWDLLKASLKKGWDAKHWIYIQVGQKGGVKVGEGNHRLAIAREIGIRKLPVRIDFYVGRVTKSPQHPERVHVSKPKTVKRAPPEPKTPEEKAAMQRDVDHILQLLGMK